MRRGTRKYLIGQGFHGLSELEVLGGDAAGVVRGQVDDDLVVDVEPLGMVVALLGEQRAPGS
jgi:hypothetical protein